MSMGSDDFLRTVQAQAGRAVGVVGTGGPMRLNGHFWTYAEIKSGLALRQDWDVAEDLVPFYGDWHEVICLSLSTGEVTYLDDARRVIASWPDTEAFLASLVAQMPEEAPAHAPRLMRTEISPSLTAKVQALLRAKKP
jgi:hypothetical protein